MAKKKDKFAQMQQSEGVGSFQESLVQAAQTVAAIEQKQGTASSSNKPSAETAEPKAQPSTGGSSPSSSSSSSSSSSGDGSTRYTHLPNPRIPVRLYNLASQYCNNFDNMTRQDWMELAIVEKLYRDEQLPKEEYEAYSNEIRNRPPRGQRKYSKVQADK